MGYIHQFQVALVDLVPYALRGDNTSLSLEVFDDVSFGFADGSPREVIQVHHSLNSERELIDTSNKLWKTLAIWSTEWSQLEGDERRVMSLVTTQAARPNTGLAALRPDSFDLDYAVHALRGVAADEDGAAGTAEYRRQFLDLGDVELRRMLANVRVLDASPTAEQNRQRLEDALRPSHRSEYVPSMADGVEGRWWPRVVRALRDAADISADDVRADVDDVRDSLSRTSLPVLRLEDFSAEDLPDVDEDAALFLRCLDAIGVSPTRRTLAIDDYRRAFAHRSRWARRGLLGPTEYDNYETDLFHAWVIACDRMLRALDEQATTDERSSAGHNLWDELEQNALTPLRRDLTDSFVQRGSFHQLADRSRVAWHPDAAEPIHAQVAVRPNEEAA